MKERVSNGAREIRWELIPKVQCRLLKRAISDFQVIPALPQDFSWYIMTVVFSYRITPSWT